MFLSLMVSFVYCCGVGRLIIFLLMKMVPVRPGRVVTTAHLHRNVKLNSLIKLNSRLCSSLSPFALIMFSQNRSKS